MTLIKFDMRSERLQQVALSERYLAYGLKTGAVRVLNRDTASRALFKGHAAALAGITCFGPRADVLASVSLLGDVCVRRLKEGPGPDGEPTPAEELLLTASLGQGDSADAAADAAAADGAAPYCLAWHPLTQQILAAAAGSNVAIFEVPTEPPTTQPPPAVAPGIRYRLPTLLGDSRARVTCIAFSMSGHLMVAGDSTGRAHVWALEGDDDSDAPLHSWSPHAGAPVSSVAFLQQASDGACVLLTAAARNTALRSWALPAPGSDAAPVCLQSLDFHCSCSSSGLLCQLSVQPELQLVLLADARRKQVYTLHYTTGGTNGSGSCSVRLDYAAFFSVKQPILSFAATTEAVESQAVPGEVQPRQLLLFTQQTDAIQQYTLDPYLCRPPPPRPPTASGTPAAAAAGAVPPCAGDAAAAHEQRGRSSTAQGEASAAAAQEDTLSSAPHREDDGASCAPEAAGAAAAVAAVAAAAAAVPPPAQLPTPGRLLAASKTEEQSTPSAAAALSAATSLESSAAHFRDGGSRANSASAPLPPMPTSSLLHSAEKSVPAAAAAAAPVPVPIHVAELVAAPVNEGGAASPGDIGELQRQMAQLLSMQQQLAAQLQTSSTQTIAGAAHQQRCTGVAMACASNMSSTHAC